MWAATAWDDADWDEEQAEELAVRSLRAQRPAFEVGRDGRAVPLGAAPLGNHARGWTVMGRLRQRQRQARMARITWVAEQERLSSQLILALPSMEELRSSLRPVWTGGLCVIALLFAQPDSDAIRTLDARGEYFDHRTGEMWDLFFPGYYKAADPEWEWGVGGRPVGRDFAASWFFHPRDFDMFRRDVEHFCGGRWRYSGGSDLVVVSGNVPAEGDITIDWNSIVGGPLTEADGSRTLTLAQVIERLSTDLESGSGDPAHGLEAVVELELVKAERKAARDILVGALSEIAAALAKAGLGL